MSKIFHSVHKEISLQIKYQMGILKLVFPFNISETQTNVIFHDRNVVSGHKGSINIIFLTQITKSNLL